MDTCDICKKKLLLKCIKAIYNVTSTDISEELHISKSVVSRHIVGERYSVLVDKYFINKCFGIKLY